MEIANWRKAIGFTQKNMAEVFGVTTHTYFRKEKGQSPFTDEEKIIFRNLVNEFFPGVSIGELFFDESAKNLKELREVD